MPRSETPDTKTPAGRPRRWPAGPILVLALLAAAASGVGVDYYRQSAPPEALANATYVGRQSCIKCHQQEHEDWVGSHHDLAMDLATDATVLGDFDDATFERLGVTTRFYRNGERFMVRTEGPDGEPGDFEVKYTLGVDPLQQYMVELEPAELDPAEEGAVGRVQVLRVSWDTHNKKWFYVPPPDVVDERILPGDPLHWTGVTQNWNTTCAVCHSTNLQKNYDLATNRYHTTFSEIDVSCEECHGPASLHVELAESTSLFWDRTHGYGLAELRSLDSTIQIEACAKCHARRNAVHASFRPGTPLLDSYEPALLHEGLYHADGQILDEVYVYGSFVQSKMHAKGVRCTDCHNPHSLKLERPGNQMCAKCHEPAKYDVVAHHHHKPGTEGAECVACHMPASTYMVVDPRRDHSLRVPRPDLTVSVGTPNACNGCHTKPDESPAWAAAAVDRWYGKRGDDPPWHWAPALAAGRAGDPGGESLLAEVTRRETAPAIARATAVELLGRYEGPNGRRTIAEALESREPLIRLAATRVVAPSPETLASLAQRLTDPARAVRIEAARRLAGMPADRLSADQIDARNAGLREYRQQQAESGDHAGSHMNLSNLALEIGDRPTAIEELRTAIRLEPYLSGPRGMLATLLESELGRDPGGSGAAEAEIERLRLEEIERLERDRGFLPNGAGIHYRLGLLRFQVQQFAAAEAALAEAARLEPQNYEYRLALVLLQERRFNLSSGVTEDFDRAVESLKALNELRPNDPAARQILQRLMAAKRAKAKQSSKD